MSDHPADPVKPSDSVEDLLIAKLDKSYLKFSLEDKK